ncbi:prepilin peptidase CpaA [Marinobacter daqiaonensis]|uniref:Prepilin peptidase CpaA n=1 Tax=Marinobacter daqiaonensis TaxID=650891 RepID=A0A1I6JG38_9GAMM|nr:A24 family peptidase [Marinobacter daqiaonensis]SFR77945.1 prepilin peptidase CpaA [Marinobacter daqiaonensis]
MWVDLFPLILAVPILILLWISAVWDLRHRRIPNVIVFTGAGLGIALQIGLFGLSGLLDGLFGLGIGLAILMPGYLMGTTGAGDVKLMATVGTFLGPHNILIAGLASIAVGGVIALGFMFLAIFSADSPSPWQRYGLMFRTLFATGRPIYLRPAEGEVMGRKFPFAVSIAVGTSLFLIWQSPLIRVAG